MIGLDTNVVVRAMAQDDDEQSPPAASLLRELSAEEPGFIATVVFVEIYWVLTRAYGMERHDVARMLAGLAQAEGIVAEAPIAVEAAGAAAQQGYDFAGALIAFAAKRAGCAKTVTFDRKAARQPGWELL